MDNGCKKSNREPNPYESASLPSLILFAYQKDLLKKGAREELREQHIYETLESQDSERLTKTFTERWRTETEQKKRPHLLNVVIKLYGCRVFLVGLAYTLINTITRVFQPQFLGALLAHFSAKADDVEKDISQAYINALGISLCVLISVVIYHPFLLYTSNVGLKIRVACCSLIYKKLLRIKTSVLPDGLSGMAINLMSNDASRFDNGMNFVHDMYKGPMEFVIFGYLIYQEIGKSGLAGLACILALVPLQVWMGTQSGTFRLKTARKTDSRVRFMDEIIQGIQVIKMYAWESSFARLIDKIRSEEVKYVKGTLLIRGTLALFPIVTQVAIFISLLMCVLFGFELNASKVFIITAYFNYLYSSMLHMWPCAIISLVEVLVSARRIQEFLLMPESKKDMTQTRPIYNQLIGKSLDEQEIPFVIRVLEEEGIKKTETHQSEIGVRLKNVTAFYPRKNENCLVGVRAIDMEVGRGELCAVVGPVGSGKSTLLNVILGELQIDTGVITVQGRKSFASQDPWLFEGSVRQNIQFSEPFEQKRYDEVVRACELDTDFDGWPGGDSTIVGERGISLSGGQKARINLARAVYRHADIYILDAPLAALDPQVGELVYDNCIKSFLKDKVCVLATHQLHYLKDTRNIILMKSGQVEATGSYEKLLKDTSFFKVPKTITRNTKLLDEEDDDASNKSLNVFIDKKSEEHQQTGAVKFKTYRAYFDSLQNNWRMAAVISLFIVTQSTTSGVDFFVSKWIDFKEKYDYSRDHSYHMAIYTGMIVTLLVISFTRSFSFYSMCVDISRNIHGALYDGVVRSAMSFFNCNPSGRVLNRFSYDIGQIDVKLPVALMECLSFIFQYFAILSVVTFVNYLLLIPTLLLTIIFYHLRKLYVRTSRNIKRIEALTRSPIYSHANATLQGLATIRAHKGQLVLAREFNQHQNLNTSAFFMFQSTTRAFGLWLELACVIYVTIVTFSFLIIEQEFSSGNVGLAISQVFSLVFMAQWGMRQTAELENQMTSVERVLEYTKLENEEEPEVDSSKFVKPSTDWPNMGSIEFKNLNFKYSPGGKFVLNDLNVSIKSNEKLGVIGRTGAGKSSIIQALFRLGVNDGDIIIDGININRIRLADLRCRISIIPQDPILFTGTLRYNLDPFDTKDDFDIWNALEQVELKEMVKRVKDGLQMTISDGGTNFSMGERQLVCLARAILRNNKILILDEATANVDPKTDLLIQKTIRTKFNDCTVITIAHRLNTILDCDRVMIVDGGQVQAFDLPSNIILMDTVIN